MEFKKLKLTLFKNDYPEHIITKEIQKFINKRHPNQNENSISNESNAINDANNNKPEKEIKCIVLPFVNSKADRFAQHLIKSVGDTFKNIDLRVAFKTPYNIGKMFPIKDNLREKSLHSRVI